VFLAMKVFCDFFDPFSVSGNEIFTTDKPEGGMVILFESFDDDSDE
jgi:hypothetical protein